MQRIGIFSGTFDPIHVGHVQFALQALGTQKLDRVYFMVERKPRRKQGVKAYEHRQAMVQIALKDEARLGSIIVDQDRFTPHETLPLLRQRFGKAKLVLLIGDDMLSHMHEWPHIDTLLRHAEFIIGIRHDEDQARRHIEAIQQLKGVAFNYTFLPSSKKLVSSSNVRKSLRQGEVTNDIHERVAAYIEQEGLYSSSDSA